MENKDAQLEHESQRQKLWCKVWALTASASNCTRKSVPTEWADTALADLTNDSQSPPHQKEKINFNIIDMEKIMRNANIGLLILRGRFRMLFGFCPNCNSDAPKLYDCPVCKYNQEHKINWWNNFKQQL